MPLLPTMPSAPPPPILPGAPVPPPPSGSGPYIPSVSSASIRFTETAEYEKGFGVYFDEKLKPVIRELEQERLMKLEEVKKIKPKANLVLAAGIVLGIVITYFTRQLMWAIFLGVVAGGIWTAMVAAPKAAFAGKFKEKIIPLIVKFFGDFNYSPKATPPVDAIRASGLFGGFNRIYGDDYIEGNHKGTGFKFSELLLQYHSSGRHSSTSTVFSGMILLLDSKNSFAGQTIVKRNSQKGLWSWLTGKSSGLKNVKFENAEFEKLFEVYSSDENEAKSLLNSDFVERLMSLNAAYPNGSVRCSFIGGKVMLAIDHGAGVASKYLFETGSFDKSLTDMEDIHKFLAQMNSILKVIETVNPPKRTA